MMACPAPKRAYWQAAAANVSSSGVVSDWATGASQFSITNFNTFNTTFTSFRHAGWGIRITATSSLSNTAGVLYAGYYPAEYTDAAGSVTAPPTTPDQVLALPWSFTIPLVELNEEPIIAVSRRLDVSTTRYRDISYPVGSPAGVESTDGWGYWIIIVTGGTASTTALTFEYVSRNELIPQGTATMFGAGMPAPANSALFDAATNVQQVMPSYMVDRPEPGAVYRTVSNLLKLAMQKYDLPSIGLGLVRNSLMGSAPGSYLRMYQHKRLN